MASKMGRVGSNEGINQNGKTLQKWKEVRIDLQQQFFERRNIKYANVQVQLNILRQQNNKLKNTTIAQVLIPVDWKPNKQLVSKAFECSLKSKKEVLIRKSDV